MPCLVVALTQGSRQRGIEARGRASSEPLTLFKSIGSALEDLAAAILVWSKADGEG